MTIVAGVIQLILLILGTMLETNKEQKAKKEKIMKELSDAIKAGDTSAIVSALNGMQ